MEWLPTLRSSTAALAIVAGCLGTVAPPPCGYADDQDAAAAKASEPSANVPLIPRQQLFGNPSRTGATVSPDGRHVAWVAPVDGVMNVWVAPRTDLAAARPVTKDTYRGIGGFSWAFSSQQILYAQDKNGDEDFHVYAVDLDSQETRDLTPIDKITARILEVGRKFPEEILVGINDRGERQLHDIYRVNIRTGERTLVQENPGFLGFVIDTDYRVRLGIAMTPDAASVVMRPDEQGDWRPFLQIPADDAMTTTPVGFDKSGQKLYLLDSRDRDTTALKLLDLTTDDVQVLAENPQADIDGALVHPTEDHVQAVSYTYTRRNWQILDPAVAEDFKFLADVAAGEFQVTSRSLNDQWWTVSYELDNGPRRYYLYDRQARAAQFLFTTNPELENLALAAMHPVVIAARDGLNLVSYLSLPVPSDPERTGRPQRPLPLVLLVHGGPWARDHWGYNSLHQMLANRGYAVLSVNFRGSTGFGKQFINAGNQQWAAAMHDDLLDAVQWAVREKVAAPDKVAIMGGSYGGYATLVGLTFTPDVFSCGVDIVGPSNLVTLLQNPPPYWMPMMPMMKLRVGDYTTEAGRKFLESRSPLARVDRIQRPLLIGQGQHDPRVKQAESDQIVEAMQARQIPVTYLLFTDEGHGFRRPENRLAFFAVTEAFLATHLGGRYEPIGKAFTDAKFLVPSGQEGVPGLTEALQ